jgi:hypothetical protein
VIFYNVVWQIEREGSAFGDCSRHLTNILLLKRIGSVENNHSDISYCIHTDDNCVWVDNWDEMTKFFQIQSSSFFFWLISQRQTFFLSFI